CARCHDHKFDPIPQTDYYGLAGIFFSTHILPNVGPKTDGPPMLRIPVASRDDKERVRRHAARVDNLEKRLWVATRDRYRAFARCLLGIASREDRELLLPTGRSRWANLRQELVALKAGAPALPFVNGAQEGGVPGSPHAGTHDIRVHVRGSYARLGELVPR